VTIWVLCAQYRSCRMFLGCAMNERGHCVWRERSVHPYGQRISLAVADQLSLVRIDEASLVLPSCNVAATMK
jgi:hypothetical protein